MRKARSSWYSMKRTIEAELAAADVTEPVKAAGKELKDLSRQIGDMGADTAVETDPEVHQDPQADSSNTSD